MEALRAERWEDAVVALEAVASDAGFRSQPDLADVRARVASLLAQALLGAGRAAEAEPHARQALQAARALGEGGTEARTLLQAILADLARAEQAARQARRTAETPLDRLLEGIEGDEALAAVLVRKANAEVDVGRPAQALPLARRALAHAIACGSLREEVLARMTVARAAPEEAEAELRSAWQRAEAADDFNLVGAVARAARLSGVALPTLLVGGSPRREGDAGPGGVS